jgi:ABC-type sugar transport system substrate-binding protein
MRGRFVVAVGAVLALAVAGCGSGDDGGGGGGSPAKTRAGAKPVRVAVVMPSLDNDFYIAEKAGAEAEAKQQPGADVSISAGRERSSVDDITGAIDDAIAKGVDAIAVNGSDDAPLIPALKRVIAAKIPLVLFDAPADQLKGEYATYVGTDNAAGGRAAGAWLREHLPGGGDVGLLLCVAGHPVTTARVKGFEHAAGKRFKVVAQGDAQCDREKGRTVMEDMISAHPRLDAIFSTSDSQTPGALAALQAAHIDPMFVSFDAQPASVKAIEAGHILDADSGWSGRTIGAEAVKAAVKAARGEKLPPAHIIPVTVVDKSNAASWKG